MNYCVVLKYSQDDKCYIISVPDLPGCIADGLTPNEAYDNARIVIREWMETARAADRPIPKPSFGIDF